MSGYYSSSSYYYYSSATNTTNGTTTTGRRYTTASRTDPDGNTIVRTAQQDLGQPAIVEERRYDYTGQEQLLPPGPSMTSAGGVKRITDLDEESDLGATTYEPGTSYGPSAAGTSEGENQVGLPQSEGNEQDRVTYDSLPLFGGGTYDPFTGVNEAFEVVLGQTESMGRVGGRHHHRAFGRYHGSIGSSTKYYVPEADGSGRRVAFEDPSTGAVLRRESDVSTCDVIL